MSQALFRWQPFNLFFWRFFFLAIILELVSLWVFSEPWQPIMFFFFVILTFIFALRDLRFGLFFLFLELLIGGFGYLLWFQYGNFRISLRLGLFVAVFIAGIISCVRKKKMELFKYNHLFLYILFLVMIVWGAVNGYLQGHSMKDVFFDLNGYLYFGLFFIFLETIRDWKIVEQIFSLWLAGILISFLKVVSLLYFFTHQFDVFLLGLLYRWVRDTRVGEITDYSFFYRIFFQSHIYVVLILFFIVGYAVLFQISSSFKKKDILLWWAFSIVLFFLIAVGYSRSFWVGTFFGTFFFFFICWNIFRLSFRDIFVILGLNLGLLLVSILFIGVIVRLPGPGIKDTGFSPFMFLEERTTEVESEAAAGSRFALLGPLFRQVKEHWLLGSGFATAVTYQSRDPRALAQTNNGFYTTFSFEWAYLDTVTEMGIIGLIVYLAWLAAICRDGWKVFKRYSFSSFPGFVVLMGCFALLVLLVINFFTPYLNHPLGIGYLMLIASIMHFNAQSSLPKV